MAIDIDKLRQEAVNLSREQKTEILAKAGLALRKALEDDKKAFAEQKMKAHLCPIEVMDEYDAILKALRGE